ncbi:hypothetical protein KSX_04440 [Ktedonospora formicarum]|uniref:Uncharacterized protein n=1 Tax=Ktedonospora formicarum TaxID=2778364 RepID=A0A8J3MPZ9_9CHLR|nr:hypothetical protein KSX_04440 [Ktedonospora formicarum]
MEQMPLNDMAKSRTRSLIHGHVSELEEIAINLSKSAQTYRILSLLTKVAVIFLGAFIATKEIAN